MPPSYDYVKSLKSDISDTLVIVSHYTEEFTRFANSALIGILSNPNSGATNRSMLYETIAEDCFNIAQAMMNELMIRSEKKEST